MKQSIILVTTVSIVIGSLLSAEEPTLQQIRQEYLDARKRVVKDSNLLDQYLEKLSDLEKHFTRQGNLTKVLATQSAIRAGEPIKSNRSEHPEIAKLQNIYHQQKGVRKRQAQENTQAIIRSYGKRLTALRTQLTKDKRIEQAIEVDKEIKIVAAELSLINRSQSIKGITRLKGRFHVSADDWANIFLNNKLVHKGAQIQTSIA